LSQSTLSWSAFTERFPWWVGSVVTVAILGACVGADVYVRLLMAGVISDVRLV